MEGDRVTAKKSPTPIRMQALSLLREWSRDDKQVEFAGGSPGIEFVGKLRELNFDERGGSFLFLNAYGVRSTIFTDLYDLVELSSIPGLPMRVSFSRDSPFPDKFSVALSQGSESSEEKLNRVCELFRQWERLETLLKTHVGDGMRVTMSRSRVKELSSGMFMFTVADTETVHVVTPARSEDIHIDVKGEQTSVTIFNSRSGSHFTATDGMETSEQIISRFTALGCNPSHLH